MAILVVEDESDLSDLLAYMLRRAGHDVILAFDGDAALRMWRERDPELILLDVNLPRRNGWDVCQEIRRESSTPILMLSGMDADDDIIKGLELGAEDYVTKPFSPKLLQARVKTLLRRNRTATAPKVDGSIMVGDLKIDRDWRTATCGENSTSLTRIEHQVLQELSLHLGMVVPHDELTEKVWGYKGITSSNVVKGHIRNIRVKLEEIGSSASIRIIPGVGYILTGAPS